MTFRDDRSGRGEARRPGPWDKPAPQPAQQRPGPSDRLSQRRWTSRLSVIAFGLVVAGTLIHAVKDLSRPEAWAYWKDLYFSHSMTSSLLSEADLGDLGHRRSALVISGEIGAASASWFRERLDEAHLVPGDIVVMSSPGGDLEQAVIMGEVIRAHGLATAVGAVDGAGKIRSSHCASACVFVYAGGVTRFGVPGSQLGVHRFVSNAPDTDAVAETQRTTGQILSYMTKMGVSSSSFVEAMSATGDIRWLDVKDARAMNLITDPVRAQ
jgi:hypothetical protein